MDGPPRRMATDGHSARPGKREKRKEPTHLFVWAQMLGTFSLVTFL
jgi:hypothetical protein